MAHTVLASGYLHCSQQSWRRALCFLESCTLEQVLPFYAAPAPEGCSVLAAKGPARAPVAPAVPVHSLAILASAARSLRTWGKNTNSLPEARHDTLQSCSAAVLAPPCAAVAVGVLRGISKGQHG